MTDQVPEDVRAAFARPRQPGAVQDAKEFVRGFGAGAFGAASLPFRIPGMLWGAAKDLYRDPVGTTVEAIKAQPRLLYGMVRPLVQPLTEGTFPTARESGEFLGGAALSAGAGAMLPRGLAAARKVPGRYLSLPAERHAAGAAMMERTPERFGVSDAAVDLAYKRAERLAMQPKQWFAGEPAGLPRPWPGIKKGRESEGLTRPKSYPAPKTYDLTEAMGEPPATYAPLSNFRQRAARMEAQIAGNPITALQDKALLGELQGITSQLEGPNINVNARQLDAIVKSVNHKIGNTEGATRGAWKQLLGGLHEDLKAAGATTGDPAFRAYSEAIQTARMNFLKKDLEEAIRTVGILNQRTGASVITSPGKILQWMQKHPEWVAQVDRAKPGLIASLQNDLREIVPVTDIAGRGMPGQRWGSGRLVLGASAGHILGRLLGLPAGFTEAVGAMAGGIAGHTGISMEAATIERAFRPVTTPMRPGAGAAAAGITRAMRPMREEE